MDEVQSFRVGEKLFDIPANEIQGFLQAYPDAEAVQSFKSGDKIFDIPIDEVDGFKSQFKDATPLKRSSKGEEKSGYSDLSLFMQRAGANLGSMFAGAPEFLYNLSKETLDPINKLIFGREAKNFDELFGDDNVLNQVGDYYTQQQEVLSEDIGKKYDKTIVEHGQSGEWGKATKLAFLSLAESAPTMLGIALTRGAGASAAQTTALGGLFFGAGEYQNVEDNSNMAEETKIMASLGKGLAEGFFEQWGLGKAFGALAKTAINDLGKTASKEVIESAFKKSYVPLFRKYGLLVSEEALGEAATQFTQNAITKYSGEDPDQDLGEGVASAGIVGLLGGGLFSAPALKIDVNRIKELKESNFDGLLERDLEGTDFTLDELKDLKARAGIQSYKIGEAHITRNEAEQLLKDNPDALANGDIDLRIRGDEELTKQYNQILNERRKNYRQDFKDTLEEEGVEPEIQGDLGVDGETDQTTVQEDSQGSTDQSTVEGDNVPPTENQPDAPKTKLDTITDGFVEDTVLPTKKIKMTFTDTSGKARVVKSEPANIQNLLREETDKLKNLKSCLGL